MKLYYTLIKARREFRRGEDGTEDNRLNSFVLFGRLALDQFAQTMIYITDNSYRSGIDPVKIWPSIPNVLTEDEFRKEIFSRVKDEHASLASTPCNLPSENDKCKGCHNKWSIRNFWDSTYERNDGWWHPSCLAVEIEKYTRENLYNTLLCAGFKEDKFVMSPTKNEYGSESYRGSWYNVQTYVGNFKIGWRKRVIEITWPDHPADVNLLELFKNVDDTKDEESIHAWTYPQAADYLDRVRRRLEWAFSVRQN